MNLPLTQLKLSLHNKDTLYQGGVESLRMESGRKWFFYKTGIPQNGKTQNGIT
jgi:hypothetical protein